MKRLVFALGSIVAAAVLLSGASAQGAEPEGTAYRTEASATEAAGWKYNTAYIFPLTRHMKDSALPKYGQYAAYPLAVVLDIAQFPIGALGGLLGE